MGIDGYTKLFSSIVTSTIWSEDSDTRVVWITLLALSDANGFVAATVPGLARLSGVSVTVCESALERFQSPDKYSRSQEHDGRRLRVVDGGFELLNHRKYRDFRNEDDRQRQNREAQRRRRERQRSVSNSQQCQPRSAQAEAEAEADQPVDVEIKDLTGGQGTEQRAGLGGGNGASLEGQDRKRDPSNLSEALSVPVSDRAAFAKRNPHVAEFLEPHRWPEVVAVHEALARACRVRPGRLGATRDRGVDAVVALYADGWTQDELVRACALVVESDWWGKSRRGLASLTPQVIRTALGDTEGEMSEAAERVLRRIEGGRQS